MKKTPSSFIQLKNASYEEVSGRPENKYTVSWKGYIDHITEDDIKHLQEGKPLLLVVSDEYNVVIKLAK